MCEFSRLQIAEKTDFPRIYEIMRTSFPPSEQRTFEGQLALMNNPYYKIYTKSSDGTIIGFIAVWEFPQINFIEHFAVDITFRGGGTGSGMLSDYLKGTTKHVFLEVEYPENEIAKRRVAFYERLGFKLNDFPYFQPPLQKGQKPLPLKIMSYPESIDGEDFNKYKKTAFRHAYNADLP